MIWSHPACEKIVQLLKARTGLHFSEQRRAEAELGIQRAMQRAGASDPDRFFTLVKADGRLIDELVVEMAVTESYFFREPRQFEMIRNEALPEICQRLDDDRPLRAWSAGCAAGEEPYSLAMVLVQEGLADRAHILATDISRPALEQARKGVYDAWSVRSGAMEMARGLLHRRDGQYEIDDRLRRLVTIQYHNLALDLYPSQAAGIADMDLILCRNVLIYFDGPTIKAVGARLFECLAPGGWLVAASTDPPLADLAPYETVNTSAGLVYRRPVCEASPGRRGGAPAIAESARMIQRPLAGAAVATAPERRAPGREDRLAAAQRAYAAGDYPLAAQLAAANCEHAEGCVLRVRALANFDPVAAELVCSAAILRHPLSAPLHYLQGVLLVGQGRETEAIDALRQVIYLDRAQPLAHFTLGSILQRRGDLPRARRAYRNAQRLCEALPPDAPIFFSEGERAERLAGASAARIFELEAILETKS